MSDILMHARTLASILPTRRLSMGTQDFRLLKEAKIDDELAEKLRMK